MIRLLILGNNEDEVKLVKSANSLVDTELHLCKSTIELCTALGDEIYDAVVIYDLDEAILRTAFLPLYKWLGLKIPLFWQSDRLQSHEILKLKRLWNFTTFELENSQVHLLEYLNGVMLKLKTVRSDDSGFAPISIAGKLEMQGELEDSCFAVFLMCLSRHKLSGQLKVTFDDQESMLYFVNGHLLWVTPAEGDVRVYNVLCQQNLLSSDTILPKFPEGELLKHLYYDSQLDKNQVEDIMMVVVKDELNFLKSKTGLSFYFEEKKDLLEYGDSGVEVKIFGALFECVRKEFRGEKLLDLYENTKNFSFCYSPSFTAVLPLLRKYLRGEEKDSSLREFSDLESFKTRYNLDNVTAQLFLKTLESAKLVSLAE